uniref:BRO1 domain-containing protein n=1 Tax=Jaculus jaculus TaxID=51337 RepID=A0A8C5K7K2_JACJA
MATFISVQLKKTSEVDLAKPLVKFIQQTYPSGGDEQAQYCRAAEELSKLRRAALGRPLDKHEGALETLLRWARACGGEGGPPPPLPLPTAPGLRHSRLYDITFLTPSGARSTAGTLLLGTGRFAAARDADGV